MGRLTRLTPVAAAFLLVSASCRERAEAVQTRSTVADLVRETMPAVEQAVGLKFKHEPGVEIRSRDQVRSYILHKLDEQMPARLFDEYEAAYKHFGLIPDSMDLHQVMVNVLAEQVAGYYDPDSGALFIPSDADTATLRTTVISHELVHALQDQYAPIDSVMNQLYQNDRRSAGQAIFEGQATVDQIRVLMPEQDIQALPPLWDSRGALQLQQERFPNFAHAPLWLRETLIFPYLAGGDFVRWFDRTHPGEEPYGLLMPVSTSQILHPERYAAHEKPVPITFTTGAAGAARFTDDLGEFETRLVLQQALGSEGEAEALSVGWAGDRYAVFGTHAEALVWYVVWRTPAAADAFASGLKRGWAKRSEPGRTWKIERVELSGRPATVVADAPADWSGWKHLPVARISAD